MNNFYSFSYCLLLLIVCIAIAIPTSAKTQSSSQSVKQSAVQNVVIGGKTYVNPTQTKDTHNTYPPNTYVTKKTRTKLSLQGEAKAAYFYTDLTGNSQQARMIEQNTLKNSLKWHAALTASALHETQNGLTFGARLVMQGYTNTNAQFEKHYLFLSSKYGRLIIGGQAPVSELLSFNGPLIGASINLDNRIWEYYPFDDDLEETLPSISENANKISYITPSIGFFGNNADIRLGVSYTPSSSPGPGYPTTQSAGQSIPIRGQDVDQLLSLGFKGKFYFIDIGGGMEKGSNITNIEQRTQNIGAQINLSSLTVGGRISSFDPDTAIPNNNIDAYNVTGKIRLGNFSISGGYFESKQFISANVISNIRRRMGGGISYSLLKGAEIGASLIRQKNLLNDTTHVNNNTINIFIIDMAARF